MLKRICFLFLFLSVTSLVRADIGETFELMKKREQVVKENEKLLGARNIDSLAGKENSRYVENLQIIRLLDEDIFKSQKETINRLSSATGNNQYVNKSIALFSFLLAIMLTVGFYLLYLMNDKLNRFTNEERTFASRVRELFTILLSNLQPSRIGKKEVAVHSLIILGMLFMFISFFGYLLKTLGI